MKKHKVGAIIQTRMGSTRLPGKVMLDLCGRPVIYHVIDRVLESRLVDIVVIATTTLEKDDVLEDALRDYHPRVVLFRGSEEDVLDRYYQAARRYEIDTVVRITSDCPLIEPEVIDLVIGRFVSQNCDYASNIGQRTYPRGLDTEVFGFYTLEKAWKEAELPGDREHVTPYIRNNSGLFSLVELAAEDDYSSYRWTLDTHEDWDFIQEVYKQLYQGKSYFPWQTVLEVLADKPELVKINANVQQKLVY